MRKLLVILLLCTGAAASAQPFQHPGLNQSAADLAHMKARVLKGEEPYAGAWQRLRQSIQLNEPVKAFAHVLRGPYGKPNIGGGELSKAANMAYNCALAWYISGDKAYAEKAMEILNTWSPVLWDFDYNDAKLLAAWTGHLFCNAAEILRSGNAGWQQADMDRFAAMLLNVYYPLMRYYYPQANGNWDGAIIHSIMAIAVYLDDRRMFNNAVDHFLHGPVNGSLFKYIYPSGQCQESMRDQAHVQLGLGEFAGAAQIAYTQGVDLFSIAGNRIGLGYEYTAGFLLGNKPHCYGPISERAMDLRDDYEYVYRHYAARNIPLPYTKRAADSIRPKATRSVLTAVRAPSGKPGGRHAVPTASAIGYIAGADKVPAIPAGAVMIAPGENVQQALDATAGTGKWVVLKSGIHTLPATLKLPSNITLAGEGIGTVLHLDPASGLRDAVVNAEEDMHNVTICDLVVEVALKTDPGTDPNGSRSHSRNAGNRGGIVLRGSRAGQMKDLRFTRLTVRNGTFNGLLISGAENVEISRCDLNENGGSVVPGPRLQHNLLVTHSSNISIADSRMAGSPHGSGIALEACSNVTVERCEIARNAYYGLLLARSRNVGVKGCLVEGNDRSGVMLEFLHSGSEAVTVSGNLIHYNGGYGVEAYAARELKVSGNTTVGNGQTAAQEKISNERYIVME
jgi:parallel beta-helix repeat protein